MHDAVGHVHVLAGVHLVPLVEHRGLRVLAHARGAHLVDAQADAGLAVVRLHLAEARGFEHLGGIVRHVLAHLQLVLAQLRVEREQRQAPLVLARAVQRHAVGVIRQDLAEAAHADVPRARRRGLFPSGRRRARCRASGASSRAGPRRPGSRSRECSRASRRRGCDSAGCRNRWAGGRCSTDRCSRRPARRRRHRDGDP